MPPGPSLPFRPPIRATVVVLAAVVGLVACSSDSSGDPEPSDLSGEGVMSDLVRHGEQVCTDEPDDVSTSAVGQVAPPVPVPGVDILSATSTLDGSSFTTSFELAGPPDPAASYLISVGLPDDYDGGFEVQVKADAAGAWRAELSIRTEGVNPPNRLPDAVVSTTDTTLELSVPRVAIRPIGPTMPLLYGSSAPVRGEDGYLDAEGEPVPTVDEAARAIDDCATFGG